MVVKLFSRFASTGLILTTSLLIGLTTGCSYGNNGRFAKAANEDADLHPEAKQDIEKLLSASNNDATERAVLCIHSVFEAESTTPPVSPSSPNASAASANAKTAPPDAKPSAGDVKMMNGGDAKRSAALAGTPSQHRESDPKDLKFDKTDPEAKDVSTFAFSVSKDAIARERSRSCLKLCAPSPSEGTSEEVRSIAKKYSDRCRAHFGELRTMAADGD